MGFSSHAGGLVTAEGGSCRNGVVGIDPHSSGFNGSGYADSPVNVSGPYRTAQTEVGVIGHGNHFFLCLKLDDNRYRSEDFFSCRLHAVINIYQKGRSVEGALGKLSLIKNSSATGNLSAILYRYIHAGLNLFYLLVVHLRSHLGIRIQWISHLHLVELLYRSLYEAVVNILMDEDTRACTANLSLIKENSQL